MGITDESHAPLLSGVWIQSEIPGEDPHGQGTLTGLATRTSDGKRVLVDPSSCGEPADFERMSRALSENLETLRRILNEEADQYAFFHKGRLLDENRRPVRARDGTFAHAIRIIVREPPMESLLELLPECLGGVPLQVVVVQDSGQV